MEERMRSVDVIIPAYKPSAGFVSLIHRLKNQDYPVDKIIIMNTEETLWKKSGMDEKLKGIEGLEIHHVSKSEFDHGATRHQGTRYSQADIFICMTQDAMPENTKLVRTLVNAFQSQNIAVASSCQLPAKDCREIERYTRAFNYPDRDRMKTRDDIPELGIKTFFSSNVCAAYDRKIYDRLGGFIRKTIFNEDMIYAATAVYAGYTIAYCSQAKVIHSHNYTWMEQFKRNFDLAVSQADHPEIFKKIKSESEGVRLVKATAIHFIKTGKPWLIPGLIAVSGFKYMGYKMGKSYKKLPEWMIKHCTMNQDYWRGKENHV